jgi:hypothetical protein
MNTTERSAKNKITLVELKSLMAFYPTLEETSCWYDCSPDTIERFIKKETGNSFKEFRQQYSGKTRLLLKRKAISKALEENNDKMLLYCLRAMTDINDKKVTDSPIESEIILKVDLEDFNL